jgi:hypothetical protein
VIDVSDGLLAFLPFLGAGIAILIYSVIERSQGADRRARRQRKAREAERDNCDHAHEVEKRLPRAVARNRNRNV